MSKKVDGVTVEVCIQYTTGDADGLAQVIAVGSMFGNSPARSTGAARTHRSFGAVIAG